ncbi:hypothetical protein MRB53_027626 [Persea americana]|uniref:Uncharacterized protein n=1 Tax=Persea americana TaxID=3435 RepID=A0ACC2LLD3_PERAE|nr:hypothetical protein MRB53_027626 [Persea americana]
MEEGRRRGMLTHQASVIKNPPPNRNLGREARDDYSDDDDDSASASRTLFDIIQDEGSSAAFAYSGVFAPAGGGRGGGANKLNWKCFTDRLRIRRTGQAWNSSGQSVPVSDDFGDPSSPRPAFSRTRSSARNESRIGGSAMDLGGSQLTEEEEEEEEEEAEEREKEPGMVSLMSLLRREEDDGEEEEEEEGEEEEERGEEVEENEEELVCCVCMVRHKGAAFIPCGHTFCRMCSRELWASRGNCPLCNGYILEILNIF